MFHFLGHFWGKFSYLILILFCPIFRFFTFLENFLQILSFIFAPICTRPGSLRLPWDSASQGVCDPLDPRYSCFAAVLLIRRQQHLPKRQLLPSAQKVLA